MKFFNFIVLVILYPYRKTSGWLTELVYVEVRLPKPILGSWGLDVYFENSTRRIREKLSNMTTWKNGIYIEDKYMYFGKRYSNVSLWTKNAAPEKFSEIRLTFWDLMHTYRCEYMCRTNKIINRFSAICKYGYWRNTSFENCSTCPAGFWGELCANKCLCTKYSCNHVNGDCKYWGGCHWRLYGKDCLKTCPSAYFLDSLTKKCSQRCHCYNNTKCEVLTGNCRDNKCDVGYYGPPACKHNCLYGKNCLKNCHCKDNSSCDPNNGICLKGCDLRHVGYDCSNYCHPGFYGTKCDQQCRCALPDKCNATNGACVMGGCEDLYFGPFCEKQCIRNSKLPECLSRCMCKNFVPCGIHRKCPGECHTRFYGASCDKTCPAFTYLKNGNCSGQCKCPSAVTCHVTNGTCIKPRCPIGKFGFACASKCHCLDSQQCDMDTGYCLDKQCVSPRYFGADCQLTCGGDYYLVNGKCTGICHCLNPRQCFVLNGQCVDSQCAPGYTGERCHIECSDGYFGLNCKYTCRCKFNLACDRRNGFCELGCMYGFSGKGCQEETGYKEIIIQALIWFFVLLVLLSLAGTMSIYIFKDQKKRDAKTLDLIEDLKKQGYEVTHIRKESVKLDTSKGAGRKLTLTGLKGTARLPSLSEARYSTYLTDHQGDDFSDAPSNVLDLSSKGEYASCASKKSRKRKKRRSTKRRDTAYPSQFDETPNYIELDNKVPLEKTTGSNSELSLSNDKLETSRETLKDAGSVPSFLIDSVKSTTLAQSVGNSKSISLAQNTGNLNSLK